MSVPAARRVRFLRFVRPPAPGALRASELGQTVVPVAGVLVLLVRPFVTVGEGARTLLFGLTYAVVAAASLAVPVHRTAPGRSASLRLLAPALAGAAAVVIAARVVGDAVPVPWASVALPLSLLAAVAEEALFRRAAYARLERLGAAAAVLGCALAFALLHLPAYGVSALPVDAGAGLLFGWQRWASGTWIVPAATHAFANATAVLG